MRGREGGLRVDGAPGGRRPQGSVGVDPAPPRHSLLDRVPGGAAGQYAAIETAGLMALTLATGVVRSTALRLYPPPAMHAFTWQMHVRQSLAARSLLRCCIDLHLSKLLLCSLVHWNNSI